MLGLLDKALKLRDTLGLPSEGREEFAFDPESGITLDEQKEIRREIEKVATSSRMTVRPEMFVVKAVKRGVLFPVIVNIAAVMVLAAGLGLLYFLFQRGETQAARQDTATITAEGKLLEQVKRESEAQLQEKNSQINQIQGRLAEIDKQRQDLQSNMDAKVQAREAQLKSEMAAQLDAERARLQTQGLSDQAIQKRMADLQAQQDASYTAQLSAYRSQADAERRKSESALQDLRSQFASDLAKANADRQQTLTDARQRESDLQAQLSQKTTDLQNAQAQTQAQLAALTSQKQQEDLVSQQLVGLYSVVQSDIAARNFPKALTSLQAITSYVNSSDVAALPGIARRRPVDLFIVDSLSSLVQGEMDKGKTDTASLVEAAGLINDVRGHVTNAEALLKDGKVAEAEAQYTLALGVVPEISRSYAYFTAKTRDAESARQESLRAGMTRAETAFAAGRYPEMLTAYRDALSYLPENAARVAAAVSNIAAAGSAQAAQRYATDQAQAAADAQKSQADQDRAADAALAQADRLMAGRQYADAVGQYLAILQNYPRSPRTVSAVKGVHDGVAALSTQAASDQKDQADQAGALRAQLASVQANLDAGLQEIATFKKGAMALLGQTGDPAAADSAALMSALQKRFGDLSTASKASADLLQKSLDQATQRSGDLTAQVSRLSAENARLTGDLNASRQDADQQRQLAAQAAAALKTAQAGTSSGTSVTPATVSATGSTPPAGVSPSDARAFAEFQALVASYVAYTKQEDAALSQYGQRKALMLSIGERDNVLAGLSRVFDGLLGRVKRYEVQSSLDGMDSGRRAALDDVISLMTNLANQKGVDAQRSFLDARLAAEKDPRMKNVIGSLAKFLTGR